MRLRKPSSQNNIGRDSSRRQHSYTQLCGWKNTGDTILHKKLICKGTITGLDKIPVYIDSPLGIEATRIYERCAQGYYDEEAIEMSRGGSPFDFPTLRVARTADESKLINFTQGAKIIISSSGMCDAGRIRHH